MPNDSAPSSSGVKGFDTRTLLEELARRGGSTRQVALAAMLAEAKAGDYNKGQVNRDAYFPLGLASYAQMVHVKSQRLLAFASNPSDEPKFESVRDTFLDLVNYASFGAEWLERREGKK